MVDVNISHFQELEGDTFVPLHEQSDEGQGVTVQRVEPQASVAIPETPQLPSKSLAVLPDQRLKAPKNR